MMYVKAIDAECLAGITATENAMMQAEHQRCATMQRAPVQRLFTKDQRQKNTHDKIVPEMNKTAAR